MAEAGANPRAVRRLWAAAFFMDAALYFALTGAPYLALSMNAGPVVLGLLPMAYSLVYSVLSGTLPARVPDRLRPARRTLFLAALCMAALTTVTSMPPVFVLLAVVGFSLAFFWPPLQAAIGDFSSEASLQRSLGMFNVSWSLGKGAGFLAGGLLLDVAGFKALFLAAAATTLAARFMIGGVAPAGAHHHHAAAGEVPEALPAFKRASWVINFAAFGTVGLLNYHLPRHLESMGLGASVFGLYLGLVMLTQTGLFILLREHPGWHYKVLPLLGVPLAAGASLLASARVSGAPTLLATAPLLGAAVGFAYFSSIYYSVRESGRRGANVGIHEASLALGAVILPLAGGLAGRMTQDTRGPLWLGAAAAALALAAAGILILRGTTWARNR